MSRVAAARRPLAAGTPVPEPSTRGRAAAALEVLLAVGILWLDVPPSATFPLLGLLLVSLAVRREGLRSIGLIRPERPLRLIGIGLLAAVLWSVVNLGLIMPALEHMTGQPKDFGEFEGLQGNLGMLLGLLVLSWTLAAVGEELAYRGLVLTRARTALGGSRVATIVAIAVASVLFGFAHTEQGVIGVVMTALDGMFWCVLLLRYRTLWAPILAHGFNNTIGLTAFYLVGPVHAWW